MESRLGVKSESRFIIRRWSNAWYVYGWCSRLFNEKNSKRIQEMYDLGMEDMEKSIEKLKEYIN
ncbi:MAG: hypothetical protein IJH12_06255 [Clostridia bacterium]|nr:hypothetical protein [Clostridia bacterium]